jgi:hypothetical protein
LYNSPPIPQQTTNRAQDYLPPRTNPPHRNDCFLICGCIRCTCNIIIFIIAALFIAAGAFLIIYSRILPGNCNGICVNTNENISDLDNIPGNSKINNEFKNDTQQCTSLCKEEIIKALFYGGIGIIVLGVIMTLCICCRIC